MQNKQAQQDATRPTQTTLSNYSAIFCLIALIALICGLALNNTINSHLSLNLNPWQHWALASLGFLIGAVTASIICSCCHRRWGLFLALCLASCTAYLTTLFPNIGNILLPASTAAISMLVICIYFLGATELPNRYLPLFFGLILFVSLDISAIHLLKFSTGDMKLELHYTLLTAIIWWLANHPFGKQAHNHEIKLFSVRQLKPLSRETFSNTQIWLLSCICILTSLWIYAWNEPRLALHWLSALHGLHWKVSELEGIHMHAIGTGAMLAALLASIYATCRRIAFVGFISASLVVLALTFFKGLAPITNLRLLMLSGLLVGFKVLSYVLCNEIAPGKKFAFAFSIITICKLIITPLIVLFLIHILPWLEQNLGRMPIMHCILPLALLSAAFLAIQLQPKSRPKHLLSVGKEFKRLVSGKESINKIFWLLYILGFFFIFMPIIQQLFLIFITFHSWSHPYGHVFEALCIIYLVFVAYCLLRSYRNSTSLIWVLLALAFVAASIGQWGWVLMHSK